MATQRSFTQQDRDAGWQHLRRLGVGRGSVSAPQLFMACVKEELYCIPS